MKKSIIVILYFVLLLSMIFCIACEQKNLTGEIEKIERDEPKRFENPPPLKKGIAGVDGDRYSSWEEAYADGWKSDIYSSMSGEGERYSQAWQGKPNGFVIVKLSDGQKMRCKNPFPDASYGNKVRIKETTTGDWVVAEIITEKAN